MSEIVADYRVLSDGVIELAIAGDLDHDFDFNLPANLHRQGNAFVTWMDRKDGPGNNVRYTISMNGTNIRPAHPPYAAIPDPSYSRQEVISAALLRTGANTLTVKVTDGNGELEISDIVVNFKKSINV
jgi:hypothetical protein